ncbi:hypothetical protein UB37_04565 [Photobacterium iliopiscarium]|uniref:Uncharacterized protein n=1 Tax=Photobacterium iliopiscarium TaxID=56192 RepID=A0ABX5GXG2_9GAMM|nr:hypothetical protein [Photobacterium iliopiscarium]KJG24761.1 hypothetical protein UB37_04565 [Photobacterium iliopiscarium]PSW99562.1 hypothetical protein C9J52_01900 [Photobacterium iliopiscarium]
MAKAVIFNATSRNITIIQGVKNKHIGSFGEGYIDTVITTGHFKVMDESSKRVIASFTINACESYSYFIYENKKEELELSGRYTLWNSEPRKVRDAARRAYEEKVHA